MKAKNAKTERTNKDTTLIDASAVVRGTIAFSGRLYVNGVVEGEIEAEDDSGATLIVGEGGYVKGNIRVPAVIVGGTVEGDVRSSVRVELGEKAHVSGKVFYHLIEMHEGATMDGELQCDREGASAGNVHPFETVASGTEDTDAR